MDFVPDFSPGYHLLNVINMLVKQYMNDGFDQPEFEVSSMSLNKHHHKFVPLTLILDRRDPLDMVRHLIVRSYHKIVCLYVAKGSRPQSREPAEYKSTHQTFFLTVCQI